ncbi:hypothetical protein M513_00636 [Trichuris suis]|uniref:Integrase catalytic domain-containing protein n=1 Tax=Trichuris suis TaxID=68888 RepID=A0A085MMG4_9BILA|nr:hypothetical protein M513_03765 [Trichuris suis]KFD58410.1 hypothetical protein M513_00636 [Trichuris suis]
MAYSLDTQSFLAAMLRFEHRRGTPAAYWSDKGKNFVGANRELFKCLQRLDQVKITENLSVRRVAWNFIPPSAPHMGGAWEALIKSVKRALIMVLQGSTLTDEILVTALAHVECIVNGRPLTYLSSRADDPQPLTPNHLLIGRSVPDLAPDVISPEGISLKKRWRYSEFLASQFWKRWIKEFLLTLMGRRK